MLRIACPWCGPRDQTEFSYGGEPRKPPAAHAENTDDVTWADYLYTRTNPKGQHLERWVHAHGCRRWFNVVRDTRSDEILAVRRLDALSPEAQDDSA
jgi:sarcosine oxidase subunit delta